MEDYQKALNNEYLNIIENYWKPLLENTYELKVEKTINRTKLNKIIGIDVIKEAIFKKLGLLPIFIFLTSFCNSISIPGPYNHLEKCLLIIMHLIEGNTISDMKIYTNSETGSTFYNIYECIFTTNKDKLNKWIDYMMEHMFGNETTRILNSYINNPPQFKHVTLFLDGHHNKITLEDIDIEKTELYSYKLRKNGLNTQFIIDTNDIVVNVSKSLPCKMHNDDNMFLDNINFNKFFKHSDCICFDGLYENTLNELIDKYNNIGLHMTINNFCFPIKKDKNIELERDEALFNKNLGSFRSRIESYFSSLSKTFKRLDAQNNVRVTKIDTYNTQLRLCCVLLNIKKFYDINKNVQELNNNYFKLWFEKDFDFFYSKNPLSYNNINISNKTKYKLSNIDNMQNIQQDLLKNILALQSLDINTNKKHAMDIDDTISVINNDTVYEVQNIIRHRGEGDTLEYFVKWRGYSKKRNSWVKHNDFHTYEIINTYWESISK